MKRLEHIRTLRNQTSRFQAKTPHGSWMVLAQIAQERQRLEQERGTWERRVQKIDHRLKEIAGMEAQLLAVAGVNGSAGCSGAEPEIDLASGLPPGFTQVTVKY
jgi:hypothetical protein